jgi:hypothetical protein
MTIVVGIGKAHHDFNVYKYINGEFKCLIFSKKIQKLNFLV